MGEYFNSAPIHVMCVPLYEEECWEKIFGVQHVADSFILRINLSSCPTPLTALK